MFPTLCEPGAFGSGDHSEDDRDTADRTVSHGGADQGGILDGNGEVDFRPLDRDEAYGFVRRTLVHLDYGALGRTPLAAPIRAIHGSSAVASIRARRTRGRAAERATPANTEVAPRLPAASEEDTTGNIRDRPNQLHGSLAEVAVAALPATLFDQSR